MAHLSQLKQTIKWRNIEWPTSPDTSTKSPEGTLELSGTLPHLEVKLTSKINRTPEEQWQVSALIKGTMPWVWDFTINASQTSDSKSKRAGLYTGFTLSGDLQDKNKGHLNLKVNPGRYQMAQDSAIPIFAFQGGMIKTTLTPKQLSGTGTLSIDEHKKLNLSFKLPKFDLTQGLTDTQQLSSDLSLSINSLDFLQTLSPEIKNPKGTLALTLNTKGTVAKPKIESKIILSKASVQLPFLGLNLNTLDLNIVGKEKKWVGIGIIGAGDKKITLKGEGLLAPEMKMELTIQGNDFPFMNTNEYQIKLSPQVKLSYAKELLNISGTILVPYAQIKPQSFSNSIDASEDIVFKTQVKEKKVPTILNTKIDIKIVMGDEVEIQTKGLHATLEGTVNVTQLLQGPMSATGELNVVEGEYKAYGQDLAIEQGELFFTGGRIDNPGINLRAAKKIDTSSTTVAGTNQLLDFNNNNLQNANVRGNISVGVEVTGRLTVPKIQLF
ncbi:MAG: translocation/assembly module TamB domain-containing protein, partial [bacterium]|nr:translocation/assembly module TamB domain-containing protein [bacterium]